MRSSKTACGQTNSAIADNLNGNARLAKLMGEYDSVLRRACPTLLTNLWAEQWKLELIRASDEIDAKLVESGWDAGYLVECKGPFGNLCVYENLAELSWYMCRWYNFLREPIFVPVVRGNTTCLNSVKSGRRHRGGLCSR